MKIKWVVVYKSKEDGQYHCWDKVYDSKDEAEKEIRNIKYKPIFIQDMYIDTKIKIFPLNFSSIENRGIKYLQEVSADQK